ncbi:MAG: hypothetical protein M3Z27_05735 [Actinomycetota bacterium]|nr:hypothetical protein [Actinomycetota bacterium]
MLAFVLVLVEAHLSTGGLIAGSAVLALGAGVTLLMIGAGVGALGAVAAAGGLLAVSVLGLVAAGRSLQSVRSQRPRTGAEGMVGHQGVVRAGGAPAKVFVDGGLWRAQPSPLEQEGALRDGDRVVVERVTGLTLRVRKAEEWELHA